MSETIKYITVGNVTKSLEDIGARELIQGKLDKLKFDTTPTAGSSNVVTSDGVRTAINKAVQGLTPSLPSGSQESFIVFAGLGSIEDAKEYAELHNNVFLWLLQQQFEDELITKVIWHLGDNNFIDALGSTIK